MPFPCSRWWPSAGAVVARGLSYACTLVLAHLLPASGYSEFAAAAALVPLPPATATP